MWIVLLDRSGSMGDGFAADSDQATFRDRRTRQTVKLDAAVESVLIDLKRLPPEMPVSLFGFTSSATLLHQDRAGAHAGFAATLSTLRPYNGTDIAAALDRARQHSEGLNPRPLVVRILLVTDGLSKLDDARRAAQDCARVGLAVDVVLIDPTDEARDLAAAVAGATGGRWEPVFGPEDLARATAEARDAVAAQVQRTEEAVRRDVDEGAEIQAESADREQVLFTASYPGVLTPNSWHPVYVHVHRAGLRDQLETRLAELASVLGARPRYGEVPANSMIPRDTELEIQPVIANVRCRPPRLPIVWREELEEAAFEAEYVGTRGIGDVCSGGVLVCVDGLPVAQIPVSFTISASPGKQECGLQIVSANMIRDVFGSYAHEDADIVARCRAAYRALGIQLFVDDFDIDGGQPWKQYLEERIGRSDLFQLFWSSASAASQNVEDEWRLALAVAKERPPGICFIRPVYWAKPHPAPPQSLAELHFRYVDPQDLGMIAPNAGSTDMGGSLTPVRRADVRFPVLPLVADPYGTTADRIQDALRTIVPFLEDVTGLRYYPPVTYLIDEATVMELRQVVEPDARRFTNRNHPLSEVAPPALPAEWERLMQRLRRLLLTFHNHVNRDLLGGSDFPHVHREAEGGFVKNVRRHLGGHRAQIRTTANDRLALLCRDNFRAYSNEYVELLLGYVRSDLEAPNSHRMDSEMRRAIESQYGSGVGDVFNDILGRDVRDETLINRRYQTELGQVCTHVLNLISAPSSTVLPPLFLRIAAPTFGVFRYRGGVGRVPGKLSQPSLCVPDTAPAVLVCANSFERLADSLRAEGLSDGQARERAEAFLISTLVHEHTHAVLATGLDSQGLAAATVGTGLWAAGGNLNEALAAWVQRHFYRSDPATFDECSRYIETDDYPAWPYRGADALEQLFVVDGIVEIRRFVRMFREAPDLAQREFDALTQVS